MKQKHKWDFKTSHGCLVCDLCGATSNKFTMGLGVKKSIKVLKELHKNDTDKDIYCNPPTLNN